MVELCLVVAGGLVAAGLEGPLRFDPPQPRIGDLVVVYADIAEPSMQEGALEVFGFETVFQRVSRVSLRAFVAVPVDIAPGAYPVRAFFGGDVQRTDLWVRGRDFAVTELSVSSRFTRRGRSRRMARRLRRERREIQALWDRTPTAPLAAGPLLRPVPTEITGLFGTRRVFNGQVKSRHFGLDLEGQTGDRVFATLTGRVVMSAGRFYSGGTIVLDHGSGFFSLYFHLSSRAVKEGVLVRAGQHIGAVGQTGRVTGPHLHLAFAVRVIPTDGENAGQARSMYVDPERALGLVLEADPALLSLP